MTVNSAAKKRVGTLLKAFNDELIVKDIYNWDMQNWLVIAMHPGMADELDPYYKINKITGNVEPFHPGDDIEKFSEIMSRSGGGR